MQSVMVPSSDVGRICDTLVSAVSSMVRIAAFSGLDGAAVAAQLESLLPNVFRSALGASPTPTTVVDGQHGDRVNSKVWAEQSASTLARRMRTARSAKRAEATKGVRPEKLGSP